MAILTSVWSALHPNAGRNIQQISEVIYLEIKLGVKLPNIIFTELCLLIILLRYVFFKKFCFVVFGARIVYNIECKNEIIELVSCNYKLSTDNPVKLNPLLIFYSN